MIISLLLINTSERVFFWAITMVGVISRVKRKAGRRRPASPTRQRERGRHLDSVLLLMNHHYNI